MMMTPDTRALHELSASEISDGIAAGELRSAEVVDALIRRRSALDGDLNSFVAICDDAMELAEAADAARKNGTLLSPLHGVPITVKDSVDLQGYDSTMGISSRVGHPAAEDAVLVAELRRLGAIILGKSNIPQALLAQETENCVYGITSNPWDLTRTPGGSSGGEAAAVAAGLSPLGIGTDIGGSIRIPAHFCGLVGFKPTQDVWSNRGSNSAVLGQEVVRAQIGTLSRTVEDAQLFWKCADRKEMAAHDPLMPPAATPGNLDLRGMTIGFVDDDDFVPVCSSIRRATEVAKDALQAAGAKLVPYAPVSSQRILATWIAAMSADRGRTMIQSLGGDDVSQQLKPLTTMVKLPSGVRRGLSKTLKMLGETRVSLLTDVLGEKTVTELWRLTNERSQMRLEEFDAWQTRKLDAVICPPHVVPAMAHHASSDFALSLGAMFRWTLLGFPAGVVPVTRVQANECEYGGRDRIAKKVSSILEGSAGLPVGVQVVAKPFADDTLLAVMAAVQAGVREGEDYPRTPIL